jgi:hypothetical protein
MKIKIEINCEDDDEVLTHLTVIRAALKKRFKRDPEGNNDSYSFTDNNCYGTHNVEVTER